MIRAMTSMARTDLPATFDERAMLTTFLDFARATVHAKCAGVAAAGARNAPLATSPLMTLSGIVNHLRWVENWWFEVVLQDLPNNAPWTEDDIDREWRIAVDRPIEELLAEYEQQCQLNRELVERLELDTPAKVTVRDGQTVTLGWIVLHMVEETARHNGHLDVLRELADGVVGG
jgi:uncharacterized damage-inducible protein DinB